MTAPTPDPAVLRRRLRNDLRRMRETARVTQREVAAKMDWSLSKLIRIETGQVSISTNDLRALLSYYEVTDEARVKDLLDSARVSRAPSWWSSYKGIASDEYITFLGYEASATYIRNFEPVVVPGILQTEDYARAVISRLSERSGREIDSLVELRLERQHRLLPDGGPEMYFILDEAVIRREVGSPKVMQAQLNHLIDLNSRTNIEIFVMPFKEGLHPLSRTPMIHFEFSEPDDEDVLYIEDPFGELIAREGSVEGSGRINPAHYLDLFWTVEHVARTTDSLAIIRRVLEKLDGP
jgi:transcriptional regulator with XRE-family HTH domain